MDEGFKLLGLQTFSRLTTLNIQARHLSSFSDLPPTLKYLKIQFHYLTANKIPSDTTTFLHNTGDPKKTQWPLLKSVLIYGSVIKNLLKNNAICFSQAMTNGTWMHHSEREDPCCLVWISGNVEFTLQNKPFHSEGARLRPIADNAVSIFDN